MSLSAFVPTNTQKARTTAIAAFERMLEHENVSLEFFQASICVDTSSKRLVATKDRFGFYLATNEGNKGNLARNTATSYHRNVKLWLLDKYPHLRVPTKMILLKQGKTPDKHCLKREKGGLINKAPPCTKEDLHSLIRYVYSTARVQADYQDAALACLMWHCFGRSSDLGYIQKQHVSVLADGAFYLRLLRVKTGDELGLTLIPDKADFLTCPLHALAVALATQIGPSTALFDQLPELTTQDTKLISPGAPLITMLEAEPVTLQVAVAPEHSSTPSSTSAGTSATQSGNKQRTGDAKRGDDSVQAYVNRMLKRVAAPAGATADLTSHSFRRGGAQHANGDDRQAAQWIFDRGAWDMTKTNKAFAYITNTAREDRKVARVLSGWAADEMPVVLDIATLDHASQERLGRLQVFLFSSCTGLAKQNLNVSTKILNVLTVYLIGYYPQLKELAPASSAVTRIEECLVCAEIEQADVLAWPIALTNDAAPSAQEQDATRDPTKAVCPRMDHLLAVIDELIATKRILSKCLTIVEAVLLTGAKRQANTETEQTVATVPRVWASSDRQKKSGSRHVVAFMKMFLVEGFSLDVQAEGYKDQVLEAGRHAEAAVLAFLKTRNSRAKGAGSVLRALRPLHKSGALDEYIVAYKQRLAIGRIQNPTPIDTQYIIAVVGHV